MSFRKQIIRAIAKGKKKFFPPGSLFFLSFGGSSFAKASSDFFSISVYGGLENILLSKF